MDFVGTGKTITAAQVSTVAGYLGCEVAALRAVMTVEAGKSGWDAKGRLKMRFEPHVLYREIKDAATRQMAVSAGVAYAKANIKGVPADSYPMLEKAAKIVGWEVACRCASWGFGQIMGFNHKAVGYTTAVAMVEAFKRGEGAQLFAMAKFIVTNKIQGKLKAKDWAGFAYVYNGSGYAAGGYHTKLSRAYLARPAAEKVTPPPATAADIALLIGEAAERPAPEKTTPGEVAKVALPAAGAVGLLAILATWGREWLCAAIGIACGG